MATDPTDAEREALARLIDQLPENVAGYGPATQDARRRSLCVADRILAAGYRSPASRCPLGLDDNPTICSATCKSCEAWRDYIRRNYTNNAEVAASLLRAWEMGRDAAAGECDRTAAEASDRADYWRKHDDTVVEMHEMGEEAAEDCAKAIRSLTPPPDLMQLAGDTVNPAADRMEAVARQAIREVDGIGYNTDDLIRQLAAAKTPGVLQICPICDIEGCLHFADPSSGERRAPASPRQLTDRRREALMIAYMALGRVGVPGDEPFNRELEAIRGQIFGWSMNPIPVPEEGGDE